MRCSHFPESFEWYQLNYYLLFHKRRLSNFNRSWRKEFDIRDLPSTNKADPEACALQGFDFLGLVFSRALLQGRFIVS
jgi:hypothetical protein